MNYHVPKIDSLVGSSERSRPTCPVRGCPLPAKWRIRIPTTLPSGEAWSRMAWRCEVHGREWAERNSLAFPPE